MTVPVTPPREAVLEGVRRRLAAVAAPPLPAGRLPSALLVVASSSRGGSSVFAELLRGCSHLLHLPAEVNPHLILAGLGYPESGEGSDLLTGAPADRLAAVRAAVLAEAGRPATGAFGREALERFARDLYRRLTIQWPEVVFALDEVSGWALATWHELRLEHGWAAESFGDHQLFHVLFLARARRRFPVVNPYYYDLSPALVARFAPDVPLPDGPPGGVIIEEPPFVAVRPWEPASTLGGPLPPLVIKTPSNVYRLPLFRDLFPGVPLRTLHLLRNPAAAINGLVDGWRFRGFFSHRPGVELRIAGYSDEFPAWGRWWWKFDLPPGWRDWTARPLAEVCGFQWRAAHEAVLAFHEQHPGAYLRLRSEDILGGAARRHPALAELARWLGLEERLLEALPFDDLPPVMATAAPRQRRWFARAAVLEPVLADPAIARTAARLGYPPDRDGWT